MKIAGYTLFSLGIGFGILLGLAALGGADLPPMVYSIVFGFVVVGWRMRRAAPKSTAAGVTPQGTIHLPMTETVVRIVAQRRVRARRVIAWIVAGGSLFFTTAGLFLMRIARDPAGVAVLIGILTFAFAAIVGAIWYFVGDRPARKDTVAPSYLRSSGPLAVFDVTRGAAKLVEVGGQVFLLDSLKNYKLLKSLDWATIDHTPNGHTILGVWDRHGRNVFHLPGYETGHETGHSATREFSPLHERP